ncbi:MAG TPA: hypothetical protein PK264_03990 [Hyphomicrobiaceae bacterium]|nr:hypothetical protein [Hyphomicrobiaceae bacterium]
MPLAGSGFLAIWNDTADGGDAEWRQWHTVEHMPERVGVAGFLAGRRYAARGPAAERYFTLYQGESIATFSSAPYLARLDNPTSWTVKTAPLFEKFLRGACRTLASAGNGMGGAIATIRLAVSNPGRLERASGDICRRIVAGDIARDLIAAHIGRCDPNITGVPTRERAARGNRSEPVFDAVLLVEGIGGAAVEAGLPGLEALLQHEIHGAEPSVVGIYELEICLEKQHLPPT